jgi:hypothetical protein
MKLLRRLKLLWQMAEREEYLQKRLTPAEFNVLNQRSEHKQAQIIKINDSVENFLKSEK